MGFGVARDGPRQDVLDENDVHGVAPISGVTSSGPRTMPLEQLSGREGNNNQRAKNQPNPNRVHYHRRDTPQAPPRHPTHIGRTQPPRVRYHERKGKDHGTA